MENTINELYKVRFSEAERRVKQQIWSVLCENYFQTYVDRNDTILDIACGFGEFLTYIGAKRKIGIDINEGVKEILPDSIEFHKGSALDLKMIADETIDVVFVSNFFEHLLTKDHMLKVLLEVKRVLRSGGTFMMLQPNYKYCSKDYWDFFDHHLAISHLTMQEALEMTGFNIKIIKAKFLPFSTKSKLPKHPIFIKVYLAFPFVWRILGKQFFMLARK